MRPVICQAWWGLRLARSHSAEAFCLPQPVLPPHHCSSQRMQFSQACPGCHSYHHSSTHFSQNEPAYFKQFKVQFHGSFRWSKSRLHPPASPIPSSAFPSLTVLVLCSISHRALPGRLLLAVQLRIQETTESVLGSSTSVGKAVTNTGNAVLCAVSFRNFRRLAVCFFFFQCCNLY